MATAKTHPFYWTYAPSDTLEMSFTADSSHDVAVLGRISAPGLKGLVGAFDSDNLFHGYSLSLKGQTQDLTIGVDFVFPTKASVTLNAKLVDAKGNPKDPLTTTISGTAGQGRHMVLSLYHP
jgi:hypothetical protein